MRFQNTVKTERPNTGNCSNSGSHEEARRQAAFDSTAGPSKRARDDAHDDARDDVKIFRDQATQTEEENSIPLCYAKKIEQLELFANKLYKEFVDLFARQNVNLNELNPSDSECNDEVGEQNQEDSCMESNCVDDQRNVNQQEVDAQEMVGNGSGVQDYLQPSTSRGRTASASVQTDTENDVDVVLNDFSSIFIFAFKYSWKC